LVNFQQHFLGFFSYISLVNFQQHFLG